MSKTYGQIAYEATKNRPYWAPTWEKLSAEGKAEWEASASAVRDKVRRETIEECADLIETSPFINKSAAEIIAQSLRSVASAQRQIEEDRRSDTAAQLARTDA